MPSRILNQKLHAEVDGEIAVFLIGMRINKFIKPWKFLPVLQAMPKMLAELEARPELGLLHAQLHFGLRNFWSVQYWRSAAHLHAFARARDQPHLPAWQAFYRHIGTSGDVGIWHETYIVPRGNSESIYINMPPFGLSLAGRAYAGASATAGLAEPAPAI